MVGRGAGEAVHLPSAINMELLTNTNA
jgi:hypothetical protein